MGLMFGWFGNQYLGTRGMMVVGSQPLDRQQLGKEHFPDLTTCWV
jgi:hypothetical protein